MKRRLHSKFEQDPSSHSRDLSQQVFVKIFTSSFRTLCYNSCMHAHLAEMWNTYWESKGEHLNQH